MAQTKSPTAKSVLTEDDLREIALVRKYGAPDVYINADEAGWHPWVNGLMIKPYRYETKSGSFAFVLWAPKAAVLGKHRHRGGGHSSHPPGRMGILRIQLERAQRRLCSRKPGHDSHLENGRRRAGGVHRERIDRILQRR